MKNILVIADIHISDYANYNYNTKSRLYQSRLLAEKIKKAGRDNECDVLVIAGDVFERSVSRPKVINIVKQFLDDVMTGFKYGYIILGNHDLDEKSVDQDPDNSTLSAILPSNLFYADQKIVNEDGECTIAFSNWKPTFDLSWITSPVDLLISHATINYDNGPYKGQELDESKFNLAILGDIHKHAVKGKLVSVGTPQMGKVSDQQMSTGIVFNTFTKVWKVVDLDPEQELFRLQYTREKSEEGFSEDGRIYRIYKPATITTDDGRNTIVIPQWDEINSLITGVIESNGLDELHSKVVSLAKSVDDIDFDFRILKLKLKNFRSIGDLELDFEDGDRAVVLGENGNGKSSLLLGLRNALVENRSLKDFIKFDESELLCQVDLLYQSKIYTIKRGTKEWGLSIDGTALSYNNKKQFEEDVHIRLPFIDYMDIYFFNAGQSTIIGSLAPERKSQIISKFFKLDKIDSYNEAAKELFNQTRSDIEQKVQRYQSLEELIKYLTDKLVTLESQLPTIQQDEATSRLRSLQDMYTEYMRYTSARSEISRLEGMIDSYNQSIESHKEKLSQLDKKDLEIKSFNITQEIDALKGRKFEYQSINNRRSELTNQLARVVSEGSLAFTKLQEAKASRCPSCGSKLTGEAQIQLETQLQQQVNQLSEQKSNIESELLRLTTITEADIQDLDRQIYEKESLKTEYVAKLSNIGFFQSSIQRDTESRDSCKSQLSSLMDNNFTVTELPADYNDQIYEFTRIINTWTDYTSSKSELLTKQHELESQKDDLRSARDSMNLYQKYVKITSTTGEIYEQIMSKLAGEFTDSDFRYVVNPYKFRGKDYLDLDVQYKVKGRWVSYQSLSSGQMTLCDINFLSKIMTVNGLLVLDEMLKHLSYENSVYCANILSKMNVHCLLISTHSDDLNFYNKRIMLELDDSGTTSVNIR